MNAMLVQHKIKAEELGVWISNFFEDIQEVKKRLRLQYEWELAEIKHALHFIPYGVDWKDYFDAYPFDYLFERKDDDNTKTS